MGTPSRLTAPALIVVAACWSAAAAQAQPASRVPQRVTELAAVLTGQIVGTVSDETGQPLGGVVVSALGGTTVFAVSDRSGAFVLGALPPGPYVVRAHMQGFVAPRGTIVNVRPAARSRSSFTLRREGALAAASAGGVGADAQTDDAETRDRSESEFAWRLRHLRRSVLREVETAVAAAPGEGGSFLADSFLSDSFERIGRAVGSSAKAASAVFADLSLGGQVNLLTTGAFDTPLQLLQLDRTRSVANFSLGAPVGAHGEWAVRAAMNQADLSSWALSGAYTVLAQVPHRYQMGMSYSLQRYEGGNTAALQAVPDAARNVGSLFGYDEWAISPQVTLGFGATYAHYDYLPSPALFSPRAAATVSLAPGFRVRAAASRQMTAPGAEEFLPPSRADYLPPQRTFSPLATHGDLRPEQVQRYEVGVEQLLGTASLGVRAFHERIDDQMATVFGLRQPDAPASVLGHYRVGTTGDAEVTGVGLRVTHALIENVRGSVEYSVASARWVGRPPAADAAVFARWVPAAMRRPRERVQNLTTSVETEMPFTLTRLAVLCKVNDSFVVGDGRQASPGLGARFDVQITQGLAFMKVRESQWEMLVAVRSLFREALTDGSTFDELLVVRPPKRLVGGITVKF
jgi:hypothetical protein